MNKNEFLNCALLLTLGSPEDLIDIAMRLYRRLFPPGEDNGIDKSVQESENDKPADEEDFNKSLIAVLSGDYEGPSNTEKTREEVIVDPDSALKVKKSIFNQLGTFFSQLSIEMGFNYFPFLIFTGGKKGPRREIMSTLFP